MTPERANQLAGRWLIAAIALLVFNVGLRLFGFDLDFLIPGMSTLCLVVSVNHSGWARGYRDRAAETAREDA